MPHFEVRGPVPPLPPDFNYSKKEINNRQLAQNQRKKQEKRERNIQSAIYSRKRFVPQKPKRRKETYPYLMQQMQRQQRQGKKSNIHDIFASQQKRGKRRRRMEVMTPQQPVRKSFFEEPAQYSYQVRVP
jgi:hypothetical protein